MTEYAIIHAGSAAEDLKKLVNVLDSVGVHENFFMEDLIETLRYKDEFENELSSMTNEMLHGQYFHHHLSQGNGDKYKDLTSEFMLITATISERVAQYLYQTLVAQSRYDNNGKFPYEFEQLGGKLLLLRKLGE